MTEPLMEKKIKLSYDEWGDVMNNKVTYPEAVKLVSQLPRETDRGVAVWRLAQGHMNVELWCASLVDIIQQKSEVHETDLNVMHYIWTYQV